MRYIILVQATDATEAGEMPRPWSWPPGSPRRPAGRRYSPPPWSGSSPRARASSTSSPRPKRNCLVCRGSTRYRRSAGKTC